MANLNESLWWAPARVGAVISAFLMPITVVILGILTFSAWINDREIWHLLQDPWVRAYLCVLIALSLFHGFHRILRSLIELGLSGMHGLLAVLCYGCAVAGTIVALLLVLHVWPRAEPDRPSSPPESAVSQRVIGRAGETGPPLTR